MWYSIGMYSTDEKVIDFTTPPADMGTTEIKQYIKAVSRFMDKKVGYKIGWVAEDGTVDLFFDGSGTDVVDLGAKYINAFGIIEEDGVDITSNVLAYPLNETFKHQLVKKIGDFCEGRGAIKINDAQVGAYVVDFGKTTHTLPEDLELACTILVGSIIRVKARGGVQVAGKVTSEKTSQYAISFGEGMTGELGADEVTAMATLERYKDFFIA